MRYQRPVRIASVSDLECGRDLRQNELWIPQRGQLDECDAVGEALGELVCRL